VQEISGEIIPLHSMSLRVAAQGRNDESYNLKMIMITIPMPIARNITIYISPSDII